MYGSGGLIEKRELMRDRPKTKKRTRRRQRESLSRWKKFNWESGKQFLGEELRGASDVIP